MSGVAIKIELEYCTAALLLRANLQRLGHAKPLSYGVFEWHSLQMWRDRDTGKWPAKLARHALPKAGMRQDKTSKSKS
ncbi:conserved hypothetical protein [Ricinus communis]|uniref:Uncharacterized protein n=1 Tax=Ricinus communis TaxID=3988 RepID=B9TC26_RICCO|nr:conserved hypothetical protein [Ricinus communis]